jgi:N-acetylneuraminate synthase
LPLQRFAPLTILKKELFTKENIWVKRPGTGGVLAEYFNDIIGKQQLEI